VRIAHLTNYDYGISIVKNKESKSEYQVEVDQYVKKIIKQSNTMKLNNFGKHYKPYAEAFKQ